MGYRETEWVHRETRRVASGAVVPLACFAVALLPISLVLLVQSRSIIDLAIVAFALGLAGASGSMAWRIAGERLAFYEQGIRWVTVFGDRRIAWEEIAVVRHRFDTFASHGVVEILDGGGRGITVPASMLDPQRDLPALVKPSARATA
jgi:hypothetical protein